MFWSFFYSKLLTIINNSTMYIHTVKCADIQSWRYSGSLLRILQSIAFFHLHHFDTYYQRLYLLSQIWAVIADIVK